MDVRMDDIPLADYGDDEEDNSSGGRHTSVRSDLSSLSHLTVDSVLDVLQSRYAEDEIYTRCGDVLISVNPFKELPIYGEEAHQQYRPSAQVLGSELESHIYWTAQLATSRRAAQKTNQVVVVTGESGAGKTEATKLMIKHILYLAEHRSEKLPDNINKINPLIELFGNAKTILNVNSSRFAKHLEMKFSAKGSVTGAFIRDYILEKSRVVTPASGESNFHVFYTFLDEVFSSPDLQEQFFMTGMNQHTDFRIVPKSSWFHNSARMQSHDLVMAFTELGLLPEEVDSIRAVLAAILHLTNIKFNDAEGSTDAVEVENEDTMNKAASLLCIAPETLAKVLLTTKKTFSGEEIETVKNMAAAEEGRDALAKALYERLFGWLIRRINMALSSDNQKSQELGASIGFLDICGFEDLNNNCLEQLCINLANEHLQHFMNNRIFHQERDLYSSEGVHIDVRDVPSNEHILKMFSESKVGILPVINEDTQLGMSTDKKLVRKLIQQYGSNSAFMSYKNDAPRFGIKHFAVPVWYNAEHFLEKNRDMISVDIKRSLVSSTNVFVSDLFQVKKSSTGTISKTPFDYRMSQKQDFLYTRPNLNMKLSSSIVRDLRQSLKHRFGDHVPKDKFTDTEDPKTHNTVLDYFKASMAELLSLMKQANPLFVKCIKPNDEQKPDQFAKKKVRQQLDYNGIAEIARIRRVWFPVRVTREQFLKSYCELVPASIHERDKKTALKIIFSELAIPDSEFMIGHTQVFLKEPAHAMLEQRKEQARQEKEKEEKKRKMEEKKKEEERKRKEEENKKNVNKTRNTDTGLASKVTPFGMEVVPELPTPDSSLVGDWRKTPGATPDSSPDSTPTTSPDNSTTATPQSSQKKTDDGDTTRTPNETGYFWDIFRIVAREKPSTDIHHMRAMKIIKFIAYVLILLFVLVFAVIQKVSLMLLAFGSNKENAKLVSPVPVKKLNANYILLTVAACIPYALTFLTCVGKALFGNYRKPSFGTWLWVFIMESGHSFGLSLFLFRILTSANTAHGLLLMSLVGLLPAVFKAVASENVTASGRRNPTSTTRYINIVLDVVMCLTLPITLWVYDFVKSDTAWISTSDKNMFSGYTALTIAGAFFFMGFGHWENFVDGRLIVRLKDHNIFKNFILKRRYDLERGRFILMLVVSLWKIAVTIGLGYIFRDIGYLDYKSAFDALRPTQLAWTAISPIIALTICAFACYYFAYIACKLWMQKVSFSYPLAMATPCAFLVFYINSQHPFLGVVSDLESNWPDISIEWKTLVVSSVWWLALLVLTRHVWFPRQSRLAKFEQMFMNPLYCGIMTTEALLLNRRRHTLTVLKKRDKTTDKIYFRLATSEQKDKGHGNEDCYSEIGDLSGARSTDPYSSVPNQKKEDVPMIYACATMWHENRREMIALLRSLHRLDHEQWMRQQAQILAGVRDPDFFNYEAHIFFDDAMTIDDNDEAIPNDFVKLLVEVMEEAVSSVHKRTMEVQSPFKIPTPYGGQLLWLMPGGNLLFVHLKDKAKIRHRKRWSQVMYMYYLLGYRLTRQCEEMIVAALKEGQVDDRNGWRLDREEIVGSQIFEILDDSVTRMSHNTFVMALDGDTDFSPGSVHILLDRMKKNPKVGAACGRIHPIGSGPMVWYQMFEYAIGHWMQKATEHVLGCVLCSPGCFSMFRGSALMDDNVMRKYTILPTEPGHYLQYDQGEDRWLCTLLLQQGYRVDYAAAADAWTYAPEGFNEFFNQRRRWMPSTLANVMDLLADYSNTVAVNSNISLLYIVYQVALMIATLIGPGTVLMMIAGAIGVVFSVDLVWSYVIAIIPAGIFTVVCMKGSTNVQLYLAGILSTFYAFVMMIVFVGVIITAVRESIFHPSVIVITILIIIFIFAGLCHPLEMYCLPPGALYLLCIPSGYLLLVIYSLCNLHVVSWGTREVAKKKTKLEQAEEAKAAEEKAKEAQKKKGFFSRFFFSSYLTELRELLQSVTSNISRPGRAKEDDRSIQLLEEINENLKKLNREKEKDINPPSLPTPKVPEVTIDIIEPETKSEPAKEPKEKRVQISEEEPKIQRNELVNPRWMEDEGIGTGAEMKLLEEEQKFWIDFIEKYLKPIDADKEKEEDMKKSLIELRNSVCFAMIMLNLLWMAINFMFQYTSPVTLKFRISGQDVKVDILGLSFMIFLLAILFLQIVGMFFHRWGTLLHLLAFTDIELMPCLKKKMTMQEGKERDFKKIFEFCQEMYKEPLPDYIEDNAASKPDIARSIKQYLSQTMSTSARMHDSNRSELASPGLANSRAVNLFLRATRRVDDSDMEARDFVHRFRKTVRSSRPQSTYVPEDYPQDDLPNGNLGRPPLPPRQESIVGPHLRRRYGNNLRYTVKDAIERVRREAGVSVKPERQDVNMNRPLSLGATRSTLQPVGMMARSFSRRMQLFDQYREGPGRGFETDIDIV